MRNGDLLFVDIDMDAHPARGLPMARTVMPPNRTPPIASPTGTLITEDDE